MKMITRREMLAGFSAAATITRPLPQSLKLSREYAEKVFEIHA
jgi:hypothetical protein